MKAFFALPNESCFQEFWSYDADTVDDYSIERFNSWYDTAEFKDLSPKISGAHFLMSPHRQNIRILSDGTLSFMRAQADSDPHTLIEISVGKRDVASFGRYDGFRTMALGVPYEFSLDIQALGDDWWTDANWVVAFQAHAMAGIYNISKKPNPPFALVVKNGRWQVHVRADRRRSLPWNRSYQRFDIYDMGPVDHEWTKFTFRIIWSYVDKTPTAFGAMLLLRDGIEVHREWGKMNFFNISTDTGVRIGPYVSFGAYTLAADTTFNPVQIAVRQMQIRWAPPPYAMCNEFFQ